MTGIGAALLCDRGLRWKDRAGADEKPEKTENKEEEMVEMVEETPTKDGKNSPEREK